MVILFLVVFFGSLAMNPQHPAEPKQETPTKVEAPIKVETKAVPSYGGL